jgi:hypothetical protein
LLIQEENGTKTIKTDFQVNNNSFLITELKNKFGDIINIG